MSKRIVLALHHGLAAGALLLVATGSHAANDFVVAASGGDMTGAQLSQQLTQHNVVLQSSNGSHTGSGRVVINDVVSWSSNTTLTLTGSGSVVVNAALSASGNGAGLVISPNTANGTESASGNGAWQLGGVVTLSGSNPSLSIGGKRYTVINSVGSPADASTAPAIPSLQGMAASANVAGNFALGSDIDATATPSWSGGAGFSPIGNGATPFSGSLDGLGHVVNGLVIQQPQGDSVALIGYMHGGTVSNLGLVGVKVSGASDVGTLVGENYSGGGINNSFAQGSITGYRRVGGLIGNSGGPVTNSFANVSVSAANANGLAGYGFGGLVGRNNGPVSNSFATGAVVGTVDAGGLAGENYSGGSIAYSYATGPVSNGSGGVGGMSLGGLVGAQGDADYGGGSISYSYATGNVSCTDTVNANSCQYFAGLVGNMSVPNSDGTRTETNGGSVSYSYASGVVSTNDRWGYAPAGLVGYVGAGGTISNGYGNCSRPNCAIGWNNGGAATNVGQLSLSQMQTASSFTGFTFGSGGWVIVDSDGSLNNAGGAAGATTPMLASEFSTVISSGHQLQLMLTAPSQSYALRANIPIAGTAGGDVWGSVGFIPVGNAAGGFTGSLDGRGHVLTGLSIRQSSVSNVGLFGILNNSALVQNLGISGGNVSGNVNVGGLAGLSNGAMISRCFFSGTVSSAGNSAGGLIGANSGSVQDSYAAGTVSSSASDIGGLVGSNNLNITNSYATAAVSGGPVNVGGLVGGNFSGASIGSSYATGTVTGGGGSTGALVGGNAGNVSASYWNTTATGALAGIGSGTTGGASGLSSAQLQQPANFPGWHIATSGGSTFPWRQYPGQTLPLLRAWLTPLVVMPAFNGSAQTLGNIAAWTTSIAQPVSSEFSGAASGLNLGANATAGSYTVSFGTNTFASADQQGYDISVVSPVLADPAAVAGDIVLNMPLAWSTGMLTISASGNIVINAGWNVSGGGLALRYGMAGGGSGNYYINAPIAMTSTSSYSTQQGGNGPAVSYRLISSLGQPGSTTGTDLQGMQGGLGGSYALASDIDASATANWNRGQGFAPVSTFTGNFDGLGHAISGLAINYANTTNVGLFGNAGTGAAIRNIRLGKVNVNGNNNVGALVGYLYASLVSNGSASGSVKGGGNVTGGLVGFNFSSTITRSQASASVSGGSDVGGLLGYSSGGTGNATVQDSHASGTVTAGNQVGGLVGHMLGVSGGSSRVLNSYATGAVTGTNNVGGLVGQLAVNAGGSSTIGLSYASGVVQGTVDAGGLVGLGLPGTVSQSYWNLASSGQGFSAGGGVGLTSSQLKNPTMLVGFDFSPSHWVIVDSDGSLNNAGGADGATFPLLASEYSTVINNAHQLQLMSLNPAAAYTLGGPVDASATAGNGDIWTTEGFVPVGSYAQPFTGSLNGQGNSITGLSMASHSLNRVGLFGVLGSGAQVQNVVMSGGTVSGAGGGSIGALAGINNGSISGSNASATVSGGGGGFVGGLVGSNNGSISGSQAGGSVGGSGGFRGGLVGNNRGSIQGSTASATVGGSGGFTGPLAGINSGTLH